MYKYRKESSISDKTLIKWKCIGLRFIYSWDKGLFILISESCQDEWKKKIKEKAKCVTHDISTYPLRKNLLMNFRRAKRNGLAQFRQKKAFNLFMFIRDRQ